MMMPPSWSLHAFLIVLILVGIALLIRKRLKNFYGPIGRFLREHTDAHPFRATNAKLLIGLACSGGGSRAAYLTAAVLREIWRTDVRVDLRGNLATSGNILNQISLISSVSGGSMSAAYYALHQDTLRMDTAQRDWDRYLDKMALGHRLHQWLASLNPLRWVKLLFTNYNRGHLAREYYDHLLFQKANLCDLPNSPVLYLNAVDVIRKERFVLSKFSIQRYGSGGLLDAADLSSCYVDPKTILVSDAVYASSAFPLVYPNLPIFDYLQISKETCSNTSRTHLSIALPCEAFPSIRFLGDGGLIDNSGLLTLMTQMERACFFSYSRPLVLAICIDADKGNKECRLATGEQDPQSVVDFAKSTYLRQTLTSAEVTHSLAQESIYDYLVRQKLIWTHAENGKLIPTQLQSFDIFMEKQHSLPLTAFRDPGAFNQLVESGELATYGCAWKGTYTHKGPLLEPCLIWMGLRDVPTGLSQLLDAGTQDNHLMLLLASNGLEEMPRSIGLERKKYEVELAGRLAEIGTDFKLGTSHRTLLDLAAYVLVHANLAPALAEWSHIANAKLDEYGIDARDLHD